MIASATCTKPSSVPESRVRAATDTALEEQRSRSAIFLGAASSVTASLSASVALPYGGAALQVSRTSLIGGRT